MASRVYVGPLFHPEKIPAELRLDPPALARAIAGHGVEAGAYALNATDGTMVAWTQLYNLCRAITAANANETFWRVQGLNPDGTVNPAYPDLLEIDNLIDYMLVIVYGGNLDAPRPLLSLPPG